MRLAWLLSAVLFGTSITASAQVEGFDDPALDARYRDLIHSIRCMQCQNQSIAGSPALTATDLRRQVRELMLDGLSDGEIRAYLAERYGAFINYRPAFKPNTWLLWSAPGLLLIGGGFVFSRIVRNRMQQPLDEELS